MSETTGQKPTRINPRTGKPFYYKDNPEAVKARGERAMWVDGEYISKLHPLHKPGKYKGFQAAAFSSLANYESNLAGEVYIICNASFPSWIKVGMAVDSVDRLKQYQTSSPYRNYTIYKTYRTSNKREAEAAAHRLLGLKHERNGEWFVCAPNVAAEILDKLFENEEGGQLGLF